MTSSLNVGKINNTQQPVVVDTVPKNAKRLAFKAGENDQFVRQNPQQRVSQPPMMDSYARMIAEQKKKEKAQKTKNNLITGITVAASLVMLIYFGRGLLKQIATDKAEKAASAAVGGDGARSIAQMIKECKDPKIKRAMSEEARKGYSTSRKKIEALDSLAQINDTKANLIDIDRAKKILDEEVIGMDEAKKEILDHLKFRNHCIENNIPLDTPFVLALDGPAGTAKTTLSNAVAKACDMPHKEISMAGMTGKAPIKGSESVYSGATWGEIADAQIEHKTRRIVYTLDEIEKTGSSEHNGKAEDALLSLMDNRHFVADDFLGVNIDVKDSIIITTSNNYAKLSEPMKSRLSKVIRIQPYTNETKKSIAKFKIDKFMNKYKMTEKVQFTDDALDALVARHANKEGGREISNEVQTLMEKLVIDDRFKPATKEKPFIITKEIIEEKLISLAT